MSRGHEALTLLRDLLEEIDAFEGLGRLVKVRPRLTANVQRARELVLAASSAEPLSPEMKAWADSRGHQRITELYCVACQAMHLQPDPAIAPESHGERRSL